MVKNAAIIYAIFIGVVIVFQFCLAIGLPWGAASMGGKFPGKYPMKMRVVAFINMFVLAFMMLVVMSRAGLILPMFYTFSSYAIWVVVAFSFVSFILNTITPSKIERIWSPVTAIHLGTSLVVALELG